jgi:Protein of unknown function (DUF1592)/Protein of unknown function (DUF1588)/Protein of unknown function (DUF1585)/Protein of unknown function (DUF1595)/Protein of unknown function (DUF1587)/Planctomycete cytochrome C
MRQSALSCLLGVLLLAGLSSGLLSGGEPSAAVSFTDLRPLLDAQCFSCHGQAKKKGGIDLSVYADETAIAKDRKTWQMVVEQIAAKDMPPENAKVQPSDAERERLLSGLRQVLERADVLLVNAKDPGPAQIRRLNRTEYRNTLRDLLGVDFDAAEAVGLPEDGKHGYVTNVGELGMPPLMFEKYYAAADQALAALVEPAADAAAVSANSAKSAWSAIFIAKPGTTATSKTQAARTILTAFASRAYRRPASPEEINRLVKVFTAADGQGKDFASAIKLALKTTLVSPAFLYRSEQERPAASGASATSADPAGAGNTRLSAHELATRLSYLLWQTMPDAELSELADRGKLHEPAVWTAQVKRLLAHERAGALTSSFFTVWLQVDHLDQARPLIQNFPAFTPTLRAAMAAEVTTFVDRLRTDDRPLTDLLSSDYTYVNAELAKHYGLSAANSIRGEAMQKVTLTASDHRGGALGMGAVLAMTSHTYRTSPTLRGKWVLEVLLGTPPPPPPANVKQIEAAPKAEGGKVATFRDQMAAHATDPACASCHRKMDPLGFALDNYDAIGAWRVGTAERPLDTSGKLPGGESFAGVDDLRRVLLAKRPQFVRALVEQFLTYALGRDVLATDEGTIRSIIAQLEQDGYRFATLVQATTNSLPFQYRRSDALAAGAKALVKAVTP